MATTTTYVATTAEGNTVARSSATREYNFVILAKTHVGQRPASISAEQDATEGAWGWSADRNNAEKTAQQARKAYKDVRVVAVEQKLTGKEAKLVLDAIKAAPVGGSGSQYVGGSARNGAAPMGKVEAEVSTAMDARTTNRAEVEAASTTAKERAAKAKVALNSIRTLAAAKKTEAAPKVVVDAINAALTPKATKPAKAAKAEKVVKPEADLTELDRIIAAVKQAEMDLANANLARNQEIARLLAANEISGPKLAAHLGMTPMGVYNMRNRALSV